MPRKPPALDIATLRRLKAFPWASDEQLERLVSAMTFRQVKRHSLLFSEGTPSESLFLLVLGDTVWSENHSMEILKERSVA